MVEKLVVVIGSVDEFITKSATPSVAHRMAIIVASHVASAARRYQPGPGADAPPPIAAGMSVITTAPFGPSARQRRPSSRITTADESLHRAAEGLFLR